MSTLPLEYSTEARDTYLRSTQARTLLLDQLNDVRRDPTALAASGVTFEEVRAAFETVWKVASFYESQLWVDANEERKANQVVMDRLRQGLFPAPVSVAREAVGE
jgi:hypothetical protein